MWNRKGSKRFWKHSGENSRCPLNIFLMMSWYLASTPLCSTYTHTHAYVDRIIMLAGLGWWWWYHTIVEYIHTVQYSSAVRTFGLIFLVWYSSHCGGRLVQEEECPILHHWTQARNHNTFLEGWWLAVLLLPMTCKKFVYTRSDFSPCLYNVVHVKEEESPVCGGLSPSCMCVYVVVLVFL